MNSTANIGFLIDEKTIKTAKFFLCLAIIIFISSLILLFK
jgi:hypothetical protein